MRRVARIVLATCCALPLMAATAAGADPTPAPAPAATQAPTVSSDTALVGWPAGSGVAAELQFEKALMGVPSPANAMEIENNISPVPHRAGTPADYKTALYVQKRLEQDGFATHIQEYKVEFTGPLE